VSNRAALAAVLPALLAHEGCWAGTYTHLLADGTVADRHQAQVTCAFPDTGPFAYVQSNLFRWPDGREQRAELPGVLKDGMLWWDVPTFHGKAWQTDSGLILLELWRKDIPGAWFWEIILPPVDGATRARTWHWYGPDGRLVRRTLCDERRL
jgi:hypothetical protein